jgi:hypothetical protein
MQNVDLGAAPPVRTAVPRIERYVEQIRGHKFKRHVKVTVLPKRAFLKKLHEQEGSSSDSGAADATLVAMRLISPHADLNALTKETLDDTIGGFYDFRTKALYVRGARLTPLAQTIVAHELTHALDDQWFNLHHLEKSAKNSDQDEAVQSLVEGDARWVEDQFRKALTPQRQAQVKHESTTDYGGSTSSIPRSLLLLEAFPYELGSTFVQALYDSNGTRAVDAAFRPPPKSSLEVMAPTVAFIGHRVDGTAVPTPSYSGTRLDHDKLGAFGLMMMIAGGKPAKLTTGALPAGFWRGDSYVTYRSGSEVCLRDNLVVAPGGVTVVGGALQSWATEHGGSSVRVTGSDRLLFQTCTAD